ncbi:MAG: hypothetical protein HY735_14350 [Verrucomicrobia bacterium]|nr:hypothetical protein [Verrucomicrobiota bacterium]
MIPIFAAAVTDNVEHYSFVATIFGVIWAAVWAVKQWREETGRRREDQAKERESKRTEVLQREQELRWKQAELARIMFDGIFDYDPSNDAWRMVDGEEEGYKNSRGNEYRINMDLVRQALPAPWSDERGGPEVYVRWCFDALFYSLEQIEHSVQLGILRFEDLEAPAAYYVALMTKDKKLFQDYAELIRFRRAVQFMERFPEWRDKKI